MSTISVTPSYETDVEAIDLLLPNELTEQEKEEFLIENENLKILVEVGDEKLVQIQDGRVVLTCFDSGCHTCTKKPVEEKDLKKLIGKFVKCF